MKAIKQIILFFLLAGLFSGLRGQDYLYFTGQITEIGSDLPIPFHPVIISEVDSLPIRYTITNQEGYYFDSVYNGPSGFDDGIMVSTLDCNDSIQFVLFEEPEYMNVANFELCVFSDTCQAYFIYERDEFDLYLIHFTDLSVGQFTEWYWDFGDSNFSVQQDPSHLYNSPGMFEVCLTVMDSMQSCMSTWCEYIYVGDGGCNAEFTWYPDDEDPLIINFEDESSGDINFWFWDFGDGQISELQSPTYTYSNGGEYLVTLEVFDSLEICYDLIQKWIYVDEVFDCQAGFIAELDTLNNTPFVYHFENTSIGNFTNVYWDFGDGNYSEENSPAHTYPDGGTYEVCLEIFSQDSASCQDSYCETITTPQYFNFGGHAFLGDFPLNVEDDDSSNMAIASLYRRISNKWELMDTREFWKFGYYWFVDKPEGEYLIRADLIPGSDAFGFYSPTYSPGIRFWENAETFTLTNSEEFAVDINLREMAERTSGIGEISGVVIPGASCFTETDISNELVYLLNSENQIIDYTYTDEEGDFKFYAIGYGMYLVRAEVTGKVSSTFVVVLEANNPSQTDIELEVDCNSFVGMEESFTTDVFTIVKIYPLPASDRLSVEVVSSNELVLNYSLFNINGSVLMSGSMKKLSGKHTLELDIKSIPSGLYLLRVNDAKGTYSATHKIIVN